MHFIYLVLQMTLTLESSCDQNNLKESNFVTILELTLCYDQHASMLPHGKNPKVNPSDNADPPWRKLKGKEKYDFFCQK